MLEYPEYVSRQEEKKGKGKFDVLRRYREAKRNLIQRADSLKGKDETRRRKLLQSADKLTGKAMSLKEIRRKAAIAEIDLTLDEMRNRGKKNVKK